MKQKITMRQETFDLKSDGANRPVRVAVKLTDKNNATVGWAWSPDGWGAYYFDTFEQLDAECFDE